MGDINDNQVRTKSTDTPKVAFISGPIEPGEDYFLDHYSVPIDKAIAEGHSFVMGPAPGMDTIARQYLVEEGVAPARITVYFAEFQERTMAAEIESIRERGINVKIEGVTVTDRDAAMTRDSDYDILRYMTIQEQKAFYGHRYYPRVSGTEKNERRRKDIPSNYHPELKTHPAGSNATNQPQRPGEGLKHFWRLIRGK